MIVDDGNQIREGGGGDSQREVMKVGPRNPYNGHTGERNKFYLLSSKISVPTSVQPKEPQKIDE